MSTSDRPADRLLIRAVRDSGPWLAALLVAALAVTGAELLLPAALGRALDAAVHDTQPARWLGAAAGLIGLIVAADVCTDLAAGNGSARATARLRHTLVRHMLALDLRAAARWRDGDLVSRIVGQVAQAGQAGPAAVAAVTVGGGVRRRDAGTRRAAARVRHRPRRRGGPVPASPRRDRRTPGRGAGRAAHDRRRRHRRPGDRPGTPAAARAARARQSHLGHGRPGHSPRRTRTWSPSWRTSSMVRRTMRVAGWA
jgi:hypothetical protein